MNPQKPLGKPLALITTTLSTLFMTLILTSTAQAEGDAKNGEALFTKSQCQKCHGTEVFTRKDRKVKNVSQLEKQVRLCDSQLSVNWFDDEIADVVAYLNGAFYKFGDKGADK